MKISDRRLLIATYECMICCNISFYFDSPKTILYSIFCNLPLVFYTKILFSRKLSKNLSDTECRVKIETSKLPQTWEQGLTWTIPHLKGYRGLSINQKYGDRVEGPSNGESSYLPKSL